MEMKFSLVYLILCVLYEGIWTSAEPVPEAEYFPVSGRILLDTDNLIDKERVNINEYPWMVVVQKLNSNNQWYHACGGSLLTTNFVLTAHHCIPKDLNPQVISVRSGTTDKRSGGTVHTVTKIFPHPQGADLRYDLALLKIEPRVTFRGGKSLPITLRRGKVEPGTRATVLGWGLAQSHPTRVNVNFLRKQEVILMDKDYCQVYTGRGDYLICTKPTGVGFCSGDSGGPLIVDGELIGVNSYGTNGICGDLNNPSNYVNVSYHTKWIEDIIDPYRLP